MQANLRNLVGQASSIGSEEERTCFDLSEHIEILLSESKAVELLV